jgi:4,5-dihydroxyphthalate decarboxylase
MTTTRIPLTLAISEYDHMADLVSGRVPVEGVDLTCLTLSGLEIFHRFIKYREWDVSEMSMAKYTSLVSQGDDTITALPVFPSRMFRHSCIWVRPDGPTHPDQLAGGRIGVTEWAQTAGVYSRGLLMDEYGLELDSVKWFQAAAYELGRAEKVELNLPSGVEYTPLTDRTLEQLLLDGDLDAIISSEPPMGFLDGSGRIRRLFADPMPLEQAYWRKTGVYPIMHTVCVRTEVLEANPWIAMNLLTAFEASKTAAIARLRSLRKSSVPLPWAPYYVDQIADLFPAGDYWPYGIEANRRTLETFLRYTYEQGVTHRAVEVEELFPAEVRTRVKV